jgi:hypothetical protein
MVIWANVHGGYFIGLVLIGIIWTTELIQVFLSKTSGQVFPWHFRELSVILLATIAASLLTPYTYELWLYPFQVMSMDAAKDFITEWQPPDFHKLFYQAYLAAIMIYGATLIYSSRKPDLTESVLSAAFIFLGFLAIRNIPLTVIVIIPLFAFFARYINTARHTRVIQGISPANSEGAISFEPGANLEIDPVKNQSSIAGWVLFLLCVITAFVIHIYVKQQDPESQLSTTLPVAAVEFIKKNKITGRMFNNYNYGGFLIYQFYPDQKVFIDGRADMYGDEFIREYIKIYNGAENWKPLFDKYSIDYALVGKHAPIYQLLQLSGGFAVVYQDKNHVLLIRRAPKYAQIIKQYAQ